MRRAWRFVNQNLVSQLIGGLLLAVFSGSILQAVTGDPAEWLHRVPTNAWWALVAAGMVAVVAIAVESVRSRAWRYAKGAPLVAVVPQPVYGWRRLNLDHAGVKWRLHAPVPPPWEGEPRLDYGAEGLELVGGPHCPRCDTELRQRGRRVRCVREGCRFSLRLPCDPAEGGNEAVKIGRRLLEEAEEKRQNSIREREVAYLKEIQARRRRAQG